MIGLVLGTAIAPAYADSDLLFCEQNEESFGFEIQELPVEHQGQVLLSLSVAFRFLGQEYPEFSAMARNIQQFLENYPNETDFWEILNNNLVAFLMAEYPEIGSLKVKVDVAPNVSAPYERYSVVTSTRPGSCPLLHIQ
ncbi:MAG: hypothetical protein HC925_05565 [Coleofasciculaceae cyanobacterium SM2_3_26]|nr:hypothetical protein [Coleofasciculaceae cyanobacterium SM2_3_26]